MVSCVSQLSCIKANESELTLQARQDAQVSLAGAREEYDTALHAAELQLLKAQDEAQQAHATAQSAASSTEQWKSRSGCGSPTPCHVFTAWQAVVLDCDWHRLQIQQVLS